MTITSAEPTTLAGAADRTSSAPADEAALVRAARAGDRAAFARLHDRYAPVVHGIALARVPPADAHDLVQDAFAQALDRLWSLRDDGAFGPWIAAIARNLAVEFHRRRRLRLTEPLDDRPSTSDRQTSADEHARALLAAICSLPEAYAETLTLRFVAGLNGPQIAACTGLKHGSVRINLHRGMRMLRARLAELNLTMEDAP